MRLLSELRNEVAHGFHKKTYREKIQTFISAVTNEPVPTEPKNTDQLRQMFMGCVTNLALEVAGHVMEVNERGEFPLPLLNLDLSSLVL